MSRKTPFEFEELAFHNTDEDDDYLELPLSKQTFLLFVFVIIAVVAIVVIRFFLLAIVDSDVYRARAASNVNQEVRIPAPRGAILDRFGKTLVENRSTFSAALHTGEFFKRLKTGEINLDQFSIHLWDVLSINKEDFLRRLRDIDLEKTSTFILARDISPAQMIQLHDVKLPAVFIEDDFARSYIDAQIFSHAVGHTGLSEHDNKVVGKAGLEASYDEVVRGIDGSMVLYRDARGTILDTKVIRASAAGSQLTTTLDAELQRYFYKRLQQGLETLGRDTGVGIALNPKNGEVLALVSVPGFDNNHVEKYLTDQRQPLFNRAISGLYTPGSVIKPLIALAALQEGVITPEAEVFSSGVIELPNPYHPDEPSRFVDWKPHGWVDIYSALARSSNIYFYTVGGGLPRRDITPVRGIESVKGLGIETLKAYWQKFFLGQKSGIDMPAEAAGFLPDPVEKEQRTGQIWRIGDTYNVSIGQGDLLVTPLQLVNMIAAFANGGKLYRPRLVRSADKPPELLRDFSSLGDALQDVQTGLKDAVRKPYGTANLLSYLPVTAAGKTGSAQIANNTRINAFFIGYFPAEDPEIAMLVLIENAREGSLNAVPIAKDVLEWYYFNRLNSK